MVTITPRKRDLRLHGKLPRVSQIPKSYPMMVRDAMLVRIKAMPFFTSFFFSTNKAVQIQPQNIPFCGVYFMNETGLPDGDANAAEPRLRTSAVYGFSVIVQNNDPVKGEYQLDTAYQAIMRGLLRDPTLYNNPEFQIQAFVRGTRTHAFGNIGQDNETPIAELRCELTCDLGVILYEYDVPDMLETIHVTVDEGSGDGQFQVQYDLDQG